MVKRAYDLYPRVYAFANLVAAERTAARGKRGRPDVAAFEYRLEDELIRLRDELAAKAYRPGPYRRFTIREPKERVISAAPFRDRVVHHALCRVIEPLCERRFIGDSYASRQGKGTHAALDRTTALARRFPYVLRCDIVQCFPAMDHAILLRLLGRVVGDADVLQLCQTILAAGADQLSDRYTPVWFPGDDEPAAIRPRGLPIGNQTSQFWANVYLDSLDQFVKRELRCPGYVRYVDDFLLFAPDKATLHRWKWDVVAYLADLRLTLHEAESTVFPVAAGVPFLGFRVYPDHRRLRRRNAVAFGRRWRTLIADYYAGAVPVERLTAGARGWAAHAAHGDTFGLRRALLGREITPPAAGVLTPDPSPCEERGACGPRRWVAKGAVGDSAGGRHEEARRRRSPWAAGADPSSVYHRTTDDEASGGCPGSRAIQSSPRARRPAVANRAYAQVIADLRARMQRGLAPRLRCYTHTKRAPHRGLMMRACGQER